MKKLIIILIYSFVVNGILHAQQDNVEEMRRYILRAQTAYKAGEFKDALKEYKMAQAVAPNYPELYKTIGDVYEKLGENEDLVEAINSYNAYLKLAPNAGDRREVLDKIYSLQYLQEKAAMQAKILEEVTGSWVAIDNVEVTATDGYMSWFSDYVFNIEEVLQGGKHTRVYRITIQKEGCRNYRESIIDKTVIINMTKDNFLNFTFADAQVYVPNPAKYDGYRIFGDVLASTMDKPWIGDLANSAVNAYQTADLPSNTQTAYSFMLNYDEGNLVGRVDIKQHYSNPNVQKVTQNEWKEITFVKRNENFYAKLKNVFDNKPDILTMKEVRLLNNMLFVDKQGKKVSNNDIYTKMQVVDVDLAKQFQKVAKRESTWRTLSFVGWGAAIVSPVPFAFGYLEENKGMLVLAACMGIGGVGVGIAGVIISSDADSKRSNLIDQYNKQITQQRKNKPVSELRFGITPSGGLGLTLNF
ncbi:MAG: hypothetical protein LBJ67_07005 [Planctomycetaceae bacterium]|jgi:hypothetical protein|nr:hypothetical protein [Planctomycetaceae bacterium]